MNTRSKQIELLETGHIHCQLLVNGHPCDFIIDTGAGESILDADYAESIGIASESWDEEALGAGKDELDLRLGGEVTIDFEDQKIELPDVKVLDLSHINQAVSLMGLPPIQGVIGADILASYKGVVDYDSMLLSLRFED